MSVTVPASPWALEVCQASIGYQGTPVLEHVDLTVRPGELVALLGGNGSGKTTLVRGMLGLTQVLAGTITLFGRPHTDAAARRSIGYVPQHQSVRTGVTVTVGEVVGSGARALVPLWRRVPSHLGAEIDAALHRVGLAGMASTPMQNLSGGQRRRALIARALTTKPRMLILDEPTAGVDATNQQALADTFASLVADGLTIVLVTHELGPVRDLASRAVVVGDGGIVFDGPPDAGGVPLHDHGGEEHHVDTPSAADPVGMGPLG